MEHLTNSVRQAIRQENWYAALTLALTLPDICGRAEHPTKRSNARYVEWCATYLEPRYTSTVGQRPHVFLLGEDAYALRCAVLHEAADDIAEQRARKALESFEFVMPGPNVWHCNQRDQRLQLQVDLFCEDICAGVDEWMSAVAALSSVVRERLFLLMRIWPQQ